MSLITRKIMKIGNLLIEDVRSEEVPIHLGNDVKFAVEAISGIRFDFLS